MEQNPTYAFVVPILPGKLDSWKKWQQEYTGKRRAEYIASRKKAGIYREQVFLQQTPKGDFSIVVWNCDDPAKAMKQFSPNDPFDVWFASKLKEIHGIDTLSAREVSVNPKMYDMST